MRFAEGYRRSSWSSPSNPSMSLSAAPSVAQTLTRGLFTIGRAMLLVRSSCVSGSFLDVGSARADPFVARGALVNDILSDLNRADG
jgi:hypothetical protein